MSRPVVTICVTCRASKKEQDPQRRQAASGEDLHAAVRALRKVRGLKEVFKVEGVRCLKQCDQPCAVMFEGKKRSTYTRVLVHAVDDVARVVDAAAAYAALLPGEELSERALPGESED